MTDVSATSNRFTLRGKIGSRDAKRPRRARNIGGMVATAIGCYVVAAVIGWACVGMLIAVTWP